MPAGDRMFWSDVADSIRPPIVRLVQQALQAMANATNVALTFTAGSEEIDTHNYHDTTTNPSRITPAKAGRYRVYGCVQVASTGALTILTAYIGKNGVAVQPFKRSKPGAAATTCAQDVQAIVELNGSSDYVELYGNQTSGASLNTQASGGVNSTLELEYLGPLV